MRFLLVFVLFAGLIAGCTTAPSPTPEPAIEANPTAEAPVIMESPTPEATPTAAPGPTATVAPEPTVTPIPTPPPSPTPTPPPPAVGLTFLGKWGMAGTGTGQFHLPRGITLDKDGNVYVSDTYNRRIQKFSGQGQYLAGWNTYGDPWGIAVDKEGLVYASFPNEHVVQKYSPQGIPIAKWGGQGSRDGQFTNPYDLTMGPDGLLYVADTFNYRIQVMNTDGAVVRRIAAKAPRAVAVDKAGYVYSVDGNGHRVEKFAPNGTMIKAWGKQASGKGEFDLPTGIAVDDMGSVYIADWENHRIQRFSTEGNYLA